VNIVFDWKAVAGISLIVCAVGLLLLLPARMRRERAKLTVFRQNLIEQKSKVIDPYLGAAPKSIGGLIVIHQVETVEYKGKDISGMNFRVIVRNAEEQYWLHTFYSDGRPATKEVIDELRARRALFSHPREYQIAFGTYPHRDQLKPLIQQSVTAKLDRFDPNLHSGEIMATTPTGREFGGQVK
jgi:hypothetical protein